jgi:hypothetical protein
MKSRENNQDLERYKLKPIGFRQVTLYLFIVGLFALFIAPFLTWFDYGVNFLFPSQVSLIYVFEWQAARVASFSVLIGSSLVMYLLGVAAAIIVAALARRPVFFQGILPAAFPLFTFVVLSLLPYGPHVFTPGIFVAFLGSALLEASYFFHRWRSKHQIKGVPVRNISEPQIHNADKSSVMLE